MRAAICLGLGAGLFLAGCGTLNATQIEPGVPAGHGLGEQGPPAAADRGVEAAGFLGDGPGPGSRGAPGYGSGSGYGAGHIQGSGSGYGMGRGYGVGPGFGSGSGYGVGPGYGSGSGYGLGPGYGSGSGYGVGPGYAVGPGYGGHGPKFPIGPGPRIGPTVIGGRLSWPALFPPSLFEVPDVPVIRAVPPPPPPVLAPSPYATREEARQAAWNNWWRNTPEGRRDWLDRLKSAGPFGSKDPMEDPEEAFINFLMNPTGKDVVPPAKGWPKEP